MYGAQNRETAQVITHRNMAPETCYMNHYGPWGHAAATKMPESSQGWLMSHKWSDLMEV